MNHLPSLNWRVKDLSKKSTVILVKPFSSPSLSLNFLSPTLRKQLHKMLLNCWDSIYFLHWALHLLFLFLFFLSKYDVVDYALKSQFFFQYIFLTNSFFIWPNNCIPGIIQMISKMKSAFLCIFFNNTVFFFWATCLWNACQFNVQQIVEICESVLVFRYVWISLTLDFKLTETCDFSWNLSFLVQLDFAGVITVAISFHL